MSNKQIICGVNRICAAVKTLLREKYNITTNLSVEMDDPIVSISKSHREPELLCMEAKGGQLIYFKPHCLALPDKGSSSNDSNCYKIQLCKIPPKFTSYTYDEEVYFERYTRFYRKVGELSNKLEMGIRNTYEIRRDFVAWDVNAIPHAIYRLHKGSLLIYP